MPTAWSSTASRCGAISAAALRRLRPDIVITMNFDLTWGEGGGSTHVDHRAIGLATLDACGRRNRWLFPDSGEPWQGIQRLRGRDRPADPLRRRRRHAAAGHRVVEEHRVDIAGLGYDFDPTEFLTNMAGFAGMAAGCECAVLFRRFDV